jgi:hypothetical protein
VFSRRSQLMCRAELAFPTVISTRDVRAVERGVTACESSHHRYPSINSIRNNRLFRKLGDGIFRTKSK